MIVKCAWCEKEIDRKASYVKNGKSCHALKNVEDS